MLKEAEKDKEITEDEKKVGERKVQDLTDKYVATLDDLEAKKEKEITEL
jgi:ribosome recycling factor